MRCDVVLPAEDDDIHEKRKQRHWTMRQAVIVAVITVIGAVIVTVIARFATGSPTPSPKP